MKKVLILLVISIISQFSYSQSQIESSQIYYLNNNTVFGHSGTFLEPYSGYNNQNNRSIQIFGNTTYKGIPNLTFVKTAQTNYYGGGILWLSDNFSTTEKIFAQINGNIKNGAGYINFNTRKESDPAGFFNSMVLDEDGNLAIGTDNAYGWKLAVNGNIRAKEIKVETGWADFVFYKNYKLPTLAEVENQIQKKGHLKDIPSSKEVEKNGIFLGEMQSKLLQKIEELTLYAIAQEKEINVQKKRLMNLKVLISR